MASTRRLGRQRDACQSNPGRPAIKPRAKDVPDGATRSTTGKARRRRRRASTGFRAEWSGDPPHLKRSPWPFVAGPIDNTDRLKPFLGLARWSRVSEALLRWQARTLYVHLELRQSGPCPGMRQLRACPCGDVADRVAPRWLPIDVIDREAVVDDDLLEVLEGRMKKMMVFELFEADRG